MLTDLQIERYSRQLILTEIGPTRQEQLLAASVAVVNGDTVASVLLYLAAAGVGHIDVWYADDGEPAAPPTSLNPDAHVTVRRLSELRAQVDLKVYAVILGESTSAAIDARLNRLCVGARIPFVLGAISGTGAWLTTFAGHRGDIPCCACVSSPLVSDRRDALELRPVTTALMGCLQASEAIKCILGIGRPLFGQLLTYDALSADFQYHRLKKNKECDVCGVP
jgi:molybdopterin/thiamine biosynthesis adenylyltransferase